MTGLDTGGVIPQLGDENAFVAADQLRTMTGGEVMLKTLRMFCFVTAGSAACFAAASNAKTVQAPKPAMATPQTDAAVRAYWTPERLRNAKPLDMVISGSPHTTPHKNNKAYPPEIFHGAAPTLPYDASLAETLWDEADAGPPRMHPPLVGGAGYPYTTNRLYPVNDTKLHKVFP